MLHTLLLLQNRKERGKKKKGKKDARILSIEKANIEKKKKKLFVFFISTETKEGSIQIEKKQPPRFRESDHRKNILATHLRFSALLHLVFLTFFFLGCFTRKH